MSAAALSDFRWSDVCMAAIVGVAVLVSAGFALGQAAIDLPAAAAEIDRGAAVPVRVIPVLDLDAPLLKLGGRRQPFKLPDRWVTPTPKPRVEQRAVVLTKAGKTERTPRAPT
jgi:hypothetical protein